jgi:phosphoglycerol transferase MdoB-like AlkP superfamily enzyme
MSEAPRKFLRYLSPPRIVRFFVAVFLASMVFLTLFRVAFLAKHAALSRGIPTSTLLTSFVIGARFDAVVLSYILIPLFILSFLPYLSIDRLRASRAVITGIFVTCMGIVFFLSLADIEYFGEMGTRLSHWALEYLDQPGMVWYTIKSGYPLTFYLLLWGAITAIFALLVVTTGRRLLGKRQRGNLGSRIGYFILCLGLLFLGARGRWELAPIDWGLAYFSPYGFANQLALNGVYTLGKSYWDDHLETRKQAAQRFHFYSFAEALSTVQNQLVMPEERLTDSLSSLTRWYYPESSNPDKPAYNVVIILMESWLARNVGVLGGPPGVTPSFDSLAQNGILFERFYATGTRTNRGLVSNFCSFPSPPGRTVMKQFSAASPFRSIPDILRERSYRSVLIYGGDLQFDNMEGFFRNQGVERFIGESDFPVETRLGKWGVPDHTVFERADREFCQFGSQPFLGIIVTLSNHEPFLLPSPDFEIFSQDVPHYDYLNAFHYSDWSLGRFFEQARKEPYFDNTLFVLVADHGKFMESQSDFPLDRFHIACLIYGPKIIGSEPRRISTVASQADLVPTILGILGKPTLHESWGRDVLSLPKNDQGFAMVQDGSVTGWFESPYFFVERIGATCSLYDVYKDPLQQNDLISELPDVAARLQKKEQSFLQLSLEMMKTRPAPSR